MYSSQYFDLQYFDLVYIDLHHIHKLLSPHCDQWARIGRALKIPLEYRIQLERERIFDDDRRLEEVLNKWIETGSVPVTWDRLIEGLEEIELRDVIRRVKEFLKTDRTFATYSTSGRQGNGLGL